MMFEWFFEEIDYDPRALSVLGIGYGAAVLVMIYACALVIYGVI